MSIKEIMKHEIDDWVSEACQKQIEEKPKKIEHCDYLCFKETEMGKCPICGKQVFTTFNYCSNCGQKLDWGETE